MVLMIFARKAQIENNNSDLNIHPNHLSSSLPRDKLLFEKPSDIVIRQTKRPKLNILAKSVENGNLAYPHTNL